MEVKLNVKLLAHTPLPEDVVSMGAKLCYSPLSIDELKDKTSKDDNSKFIKMISDMGHNSVLEHATFTFGIEGISRACANQLVRHRIASPSQKSQRYVNEEGFDFIIPEGIRDDKELETMYIEMMERNNTDYLDLVERIKVKYLEGHTTPSDKVKKDGEKYAIENARYVLPNACETKLIFTINARSLINFLQLRTCRNAQTEIRELAEEMYWIVVEKAPNIFKNKVAKCISEGKCPEGKKTCGKPRYELEVK